MSNRYQEVLEYMFAQLPMYQRQGAPAFKKTLDNIIRLCEALGNPQNTFKSIHVGGTNGKGSTSHMIAAALQAHGMKVGLYTSPHYKDFRERIKINGAFISEEKVIAFVDDNESLIQDIRPSFFEMTVALAFDFFAKQKVDIAIIEVGLGGRLDSTNIINPILSVITNISFDHQAMLGNTLIKIAGEKAGIIKPSKTLVVGERQKAVEEVFITRCQLLGSAISFASDRVQFESNTRGRNVVIDSKVFCKALLSDIEGPFQDKNLKTALLALYELRKSLGLKKSLIKKGLAHIAESTYYIGRWQVLGANPGIIADSAHNEAGLAIVLERLETMQFEHLHIILGFVKDKDVSKVLAMFPKKARYYFAKADIPRGLNAETLHEFGEAQELQGEAYPSVKDALEAAKKNANSKDLIYIGGSIFVVAEVL